MRPAQYYAGFEQAKLEVLGRILGFNEAGAILRRI